MLKKIIFSILLVSVIAVLLLGAVNRTVALAGDVETGGGGLPGTEELGRGKGGPGRGMGGGRLGGSSDHTYPVTPPTTY